jgi:hypothetical protein
MADAALEVSADAVEVDEFPFSLEVAERFHHRASFSLLKLHIDPHL